MDVLPPVGTAMAPPPDRAAVNIPESRFRRINLTPQQIHMLIDELMKLRNAYADLTNRQGVLVAHFASALKTQPGNTIVVPGAILEEVEADATGGRPWAINQTMMKDEEGKPTGLRFLAMYAAEAVAQSAGIMDGSVAMVNEEFIIPREPPFTVTVRPKGKYAHHLGCRYKDPQRNEGKPLERVDAAPGFGQYFVREVDGQYGFSTDDLGQAVLLSYTYMREPDNAAALTEPEKTEAEKAAEVDEETVCENAWHRDPARMGRRCPECGGAKTR